MNNVGKLFVMVILLLLTETVKAQNNLSLQEALKTAKQNNPTLKTEKFSVSIAQTDIVTARLRPNPILNNQSLQLIKSSAFPENTSLYNVQNRQVWWQLTKEIQLPAQRKYKIDVANKSYSLADKQYRETERNLFADIASKWLDVWTAQKQLEIIDFATKNIDTLAAIHRIKYKNQVITQTNLLRIELLEKRYSLQYKNAAQTLRNTQTALRIALGNTDSTTINADDEFDFNISQSLDSLLVKALQRADLQTAQNAVELAKTNISLQKSLAVPKPEVGFIWNPQNNIPYLGVYATMNLPLFNRNQGERQKSYLLKEQAQQQLNAIQNKLSAEIKIAYSNYKLQQENVENFKIVIEQSQTILENIRYAYLKGGTTIIDFLEAQQSWLETQREYYDTMQAYGQSYIQLLFVTGLINELAQ
jgi:cobalt-zinc-cadmium efflux system outer membrane protein